VKYFSESTWRFPFAGTLAALVPSFFPMSATFATTIHVPGDAPSIQAGVNLAAFGDTVEVACGTYTSGALLKDGILLRSQTGLPDCVTIATTGSFALGFGSLTSGVRVEGFRIKEVNSNTRGLDVFHSIVEISNCDVLEFERGDEEGSGEGAGARIRGGSSVSFKQCRFTKNRVEDVEHGSIGGAIQCESSTLEILDCQFSENFAFGYGGAIYGEDSFISISGSLFEDNGAEPFGGAAIWCFGTGELNINGSTFRRNEGAFQAGAVAAQFVTTGIQSSVFEQNESYDYGAAVTIGVGSVESCTFKNNHSVQGGTVIFKSALEAPSVLRECLFVGNQGARGAGFLGFGPSNVVENCTFEANQAIPSSGGIVSAGSIVPPAGHVTIRNSIVAFSESGQASSCTNGGEITVECCDFFANDGGDWVGCIAGQENTAGNISADPLFCDASGGDYSLQANSPCVKPQSGGCEQIGAFGVGCEPIHVEGRSWGAIKGLYR